MLHWRSRRVPAAVLALAVGGGVLCAALRLQWTFNSGRFAQELPMIVEGGAAGVLVIATHSPFGEPERTASRWLPYLRLATALAMTGLAIGILQLAVAGASLDGANGRSKPLDGSLPQQEFAGLSQPATCHHFRSF